MSDQRIIGVAITGSNASETLTRIRRAEEMGINAAWLTSRGGGGDSLTLMAIAAAQTNRILLGTSIVQTWSRHPATVAQQVQVIANLAPGRFRLGVGPSHKQNMEATFGVDFNAPLPHLSEYVKILKDLLQTGTVGFSGRHYSAHTDIPAPVEVPVMASALRPGAFELCGTEADGAISWVCPHQYLRDVALPALRVGAQKAGRPTPPLIVHAPLSVHEDVRAVRSAVRDELGYYPRSPFYARMFASAGFTGSTDTGWTDEMLDSVVISGGESSVAGQIEKVFERGASELLATVVAPGDAKEESMERTMRLLAKVSA